VAVAHSGTGNRVMTSTDGSVWTIRSSAADNGWTSVTYGGGLFVAVAYSGTGNRVMTSYCLVCAEGEFLDVSGDITCSVCGAGTYAAAVGTTTCTNCGIGKYLADAASAAAEHDAEVDCLVC